MAIMKLAYHFGSVSEWGSALFSGRGRGVLTNVQFEVSTIRQLAPCPLAAPYLSLISQHAGQLRGTGAPRYSMSTDIGSRVYASLAPTTIRSARYYAGTSGPVSDI